ncbi:MAG: TauD/TfdA family dioxygenase [Novosphingobium sp.]|nr:TauD/TfdA family dioxygenase [Novosphingobium sp.]
MAIKTRKVAEGAEFGVRVAGITAELLEDDSVREEIRKAFVKEGLIVFEDVEPTTEMQLRLSTVMGPIKEHPARKRAKAELQTGLGEIAATPTAAIFEVDGNPRVNWQPWHFDHCYTDELNYARVLRAVTVPPEGGDTLFADGIQIYNDMDPAIRAKAEDLRIVYKLDLRLGNQRYGIPGNIRELRAPKDNIAEVAKQFPRAVHPSVWTRPTGEKVMHMAPYMAKCIEGMENAQGDALFVEIWEEITRVMKAYTHSWKPADMLIWDNLRVIHQAPGCDPKYERVMHHTTVKGDYGLGYFENGASIGELQPSTM